MQVKLESVESKQKVVKITKKIILNHFFLYDGANYRPPT